jgi:membrane dipeptidase
MPEAKLSRRTTRDAIVIGTMPGAVTSHAEIALPPVADAHNDLLMELAIRRGENEPFRRHWLDQLRTGGVRLQLCPLFVGLEHLPEGALRRALEEVAAFHRAVAENPDDVVHVRTRADLGRLQDGDRIGLMLSMEGAEPFGYDPGMADVFWDLGVRVFGLTWNRRNPFADGAAEGAGGLSRLGTELVRRLFERGAVLDLAHASPDTFDDVLALAPGPGRVMVSHAGCRAVHDTPRNLDDARLTRLAEAGGVLGVMAHPLATDTSEPTIARVADHVVHAVDVMGAGAVGLGADFIRQVAASGAVVTPPDALLPEGIALDAAIEGLEGPAGYPALLAALRERGMSEPVLAGVAGGNVLRLLEGALPA